MPTSRDQLDGVSDGQEEVFRSGGLASEFALCRVPRQACATSLSQEGKLFDLVPISSNGAGVETKPKLSTGTSHDANPSLEEVQ